MIKNFLLRGYIKNIKTTKKSTLINDNLKLVIKIAKEYSKAWPQFDIMDLIQEGNLGLIYGVRKFDKNKKIRISTFISYWIKAYIYNYIMWNLVGVKITNTKKHRKIFDNLSKEKKKLEKKGVNVTNKVLAERLQVSQQDIDELNPILSPGGITNIEKKSNTLIDPNTPETILIKRQRKTLINQQIQQFRDTLRPVQQYILDKRILADKPKTLESIATCIISTKQNVHAMEKVILNKAKDFFDVNILKEIFE